MPLKAQLTPRQQEILRHVVEEFVSTGQPVGSIAKVPCTGDALAVGAGGVWCFDPATDRAPARFNPRSGQVDVAMQPGEAIGGTALAASPGSIWVLTGNQLVRVDLG